MTISETLRAERVADLPSARPLIAARHAIFCLGEGGEVLQRCTVKEPGDPHDQYDQIAWHFGISYRPNRMAPRRVIMTARLIPGITVRTTPTGQLLHRLEYPPVIIPGERYSEPSRLGLYKEYQGTEVGLWAVLRMAGLLAETSVTEGYDNFLLSLRYPLMTRLNWFPWTLAPAIYYPESEGGPITDEPMWLATLNLHELVAVTRWLEQDKYRIMFPEEPAWFNPHRVRPISELRAVVAANKWLTRETWRGWKKGAITLATIAPA